MSVVVCDVLCYLRNKFDKMPAKVLKSSLADFYTAEVLSDAKKQLLDDISALNLAIKVPHVPQRRDGDNRLTREIDDMFVLFSCMDEHKHLDDLPRYVASGPDSMPSGRMYEGDLSVLLNMMKKLSNEVSEMRSKLAAIANDVRAIQSFSPEPFPALPQSSVVNKANHQQLQQRSTVVSGQLITKPVDGISIGVSANTVPKSTADDNQSAVAGSSWANLASTPLIRSNRFGVLASTTDDDENTAFQPVRSRKKRSRNKTSSPVAHDAQPQQAQQLTSTGRGGTEQRRSRLLVFGKSTNRGGIYAAKSLIRKAVFYVGNVNRECSSNDIVSFVEGMNVDVFTCFEVKPRRRYADDLCDDRKAFRLCISDNDTERMLDASLWPDSVTVSKWHFKQPATEANAGDKRRRVGGASAAEQLSAGQHEPSDYVTRVDRDSSSAQNDMLSDDTILAVNDYTTMVNMDVETSAACNDGE